MQDTRLEVIERWLRRLGGMAALVVLAGLYAGLWRAGRQRREAEGGPTAVVRRGPGLAAASALFFGACVRLWRPLPWALPRWARALALAVGAPLHAAGLALILWGRLALGEMMNISTSLGAPLYAQQRLITDGPFAYVRHPMYLGYNLAAIGGLLLYRTWTTLLLLPAALTLFLRARREEAALAARFGQAWADYQRRVPAWLPRFRLGREKEV